MTSTYDPLGLRHERSHWIVEIGGLDISDAVTNGTTTMAMNAIPTARFDVALNSPLLPLIELTGQVVAHIVRGPETELVFTGYVKDAIPRDASLILSCEGGYPGMQERTVGDQVSRVPPADLVYGLARESGVPSESISLNGWPEPSHEVFEVIVPVTGVTAPSPVQVAGVRFLNRAAVEPVIQELSSDSPVSERFLSYETFAVSYVTDARVYDAEVAALARIDGAIAWLTVTARYSVAVDPNGNARPWNRRSLLFEARRARLVYVRGISTKRAWLRDVDGRSREMNLSLSQAHLTTPNPYRSGTSDPLYHAVLAIQRSCNSQDPVEQVTALWDAIEFYAGSANVPVLFDRPKMRHLRRLFRKHIKPQVSELQYSRLESVLAFANDSPLLAKLRYQFATDGVLITEDEMKSLSRLRRLRNDSSHGRAGEIASEDDIRNGVAIVSRALMVASITRRRLKD